MAGCLSDPEAVTESVVQPRRLNQRSIEKPPRSESEQNGICQLVHSLPQHREDAVPEQSIANICNINMCSTQAALVMSKP